MKLRKQAPAKALIVAGAAALLFAFYSAIKAEPHIRAEGRASPVDYQRFFAPAAAPSDHQLPQGGLQPHGRTRAS